MTTPTHDLAIARAERDAWQSTCEELHRAIAGRDVEIEAHLGRIEAADQRARSLEAALTAEREAGKGLVAQVEALRPDRAEELCRAYHDRMSIDGKPPAPAWNEFSAEARVTRVTAMRLELAALAKLSPAPAPTFDAAFLRRVLVATKHGPNGKGGPGPCDAACVKCEAELMAKAAPAREVAPTLVAVSDEELVAAFAQAHLECPCDESGEEWAKYPPDCCNAASIRAVRAKFGAAEVTEERVKAALKLLDGITSSDDLTDDESLDDRVTFFMTSLRASAAKGG